MAIGDKILELRRRHHMTQDQFAEKVGITGRHLSRFENHRLRPGKTTLLKIAEACEIPVQVLLDEAAELPPAPEPLTIEDPELAERFVEAVELPKEERKAILMVIDAFLAKHLVAKALAAK